MGPMMYDMHHEEIESIVLSYRFILSGWEAIVYNHQNVIVVNSEYA